MRPPTRPLETSLASIHANGTGVRAAVARALATANLAPQEATFRVKRARVDLDRHGDVARAEVSLDIHPPREVRPEDADALRGLVNPDGNHPLAVWLPGDPDRGVAPFYMDILAVSWSRWMEKNEVTLPPGMDQYCPYVGASFLGARAFAAENGKRLPTAAEFRAAWGHAAAPWGDGPDPSCGRVGRPRYDELPEGGMHPPGPGGIFDLGAWLWQWLDDARVAGGGLAAPTLAVQSGDRWPIGIRLVQDA